MGIVVKICIALVIAAAATGAAIFLPVPHQPLALFALLATATVASTLLTALPGSGAATTVPGAPDSKPARGNQLVAKPADGASAEGLEEGEVKWFSTKKGFGFIVSDSGDEIFVHYRNIIGDGRRSLRDGERVSYRITQTDKGPQAEDVRQLG